MPCRDWEASGPDHRHCEAAATQLRKRLDAVTQFLCYLCGETDYEGRLDALDKRLLNWYKEHLAADVRRVHGRMMEALKHKDFDPDKLAENFIDAALKVHPVSRWHKSWFYEMAIAACKEHNDKKLSTTQKKDLAKKALSKLTPEEKKVLGLA